MNKSGVLKSSEMIYKEHWGSRLYRLQKMLCLHGEEAGTSTTIKGTFWYCKQDDSPCHFICSEDQVDLYDKGVKKFLTTRQPRPMCCGVAPEASKIGLVMDRRSPYFGRCEPSPVRNYARMLVVTDRENKVMVGLFSCVEKEKNGATTSRGEMNASLKDLYVNMENLANYIR